MSEIWSFVSSPEALLPVARRYSEAHVFDIGQGLAVIPIDYDIWDEIETSYAKKDDKLTGPLVHPYVEHAAEDLAHEISHVSPVAYVYAGYWPGMVGHQLTIIWDKGEIVLGPLQHGTMEHYEPPPYGNRNAPINQALRYLGVVVNEAIDEFDSVAIDYEASDYLYGKRAPRLD